MPDASYAALWKHPLLAASWALLFNFMLTMEKSGGFQMPGLGGGVLFFDKISPDCSKMEKKYDWYSTALIPFKELSLS